MVCVDMSNIFNVFIQHAIQVHAHISELEWTYQNPAGFFGTTRTHESANEILNREIQIIKTLTVSKNKLLSELEENHTTCESLLNEVDDLSNDCEQITQALEGYGFIFSSEDKESINSEKSSSSDSCENKFVSTEEQIDNVAADISSTNVAECEVTTMGFEKYINDNNCNLDDLVTPYMSRSSMYLVKQSK